MREKIFKKMNIKIAYYCHIIRISYEFVDLVLKAALGKMLYLP